MTGGDRAAAPPSPLAGPAVRTVALAGRANSGKTSVLMFLTGSPQRPVNFPGTSVERVESEVAVGDARLRIVDLPGIASLHAISRDEEVAIGFLRGAGGRRPDLLCAVVDASKLAVELRLLQELRQLGLPTVVALTKLDVAASEGNPVDADRLRRAIGLPLVCVDGRHGAGSAELLDLLAAAAPPPAAGAAAGPVACPAVGPTGRRPSPTDRIDRFLLHPLLGPAVLVCVLVVSFQLVFTVAEPFMRLVESGQAIAAEWFESVTGAGALRSFLVDGLTNGLGSVLVFVPQIALLIAFVTVLEASGYMARAVFLLDRLLRGVGLTGKSFVPLASSFACAIPGILASRILTDERDRLATIAVSPLMSCSARLPVYVVLLAAFFPPLQAGLLLLLLYLLGIVAAGGVATVLRRTLLRGGSSILAMELPVYQRPRLRVVALQAWTAVREFLRTAGTVILAATAIVWLLGYFPRPAAIHERFAAARAAAPAGAAGVLQRDRLDAEEAAAYLEQSWLADLGRAVQPVFALAGFDWRLTVGVLAAFPARELVVPTLGTLHSLGEVEASDDAGAESVVRLRDALRSARGPDGKPAMDGLVAL
ncbi:MAG: ferrous iron transporter B, partial [Planctomycetes bacterium]|nr:ferrous iron transporter B [Planctomycetota bacterium]